jgi:glycerophosphoryl diester phosphodiesterase
VFAKTLSSVNREGDETMVSISAHRGGSEHAAAATYEAYNDALKSGADYAEFDIRKTSDGVLVVYHDERVAHTGPRVAHCTYAELCRRLSYTVPRVHDVMELVAGRLTGHLDLKEIGYEDEVIRLALDILGDGNFVATTLEDISIAAIKSAYPSVRTALSLGRALNELPRSRWAKIRKSEMFPVRRLRECGSDWAAVNYKLARLGVSRICKRNGIGIMVWTVDSDESIDQFLLDPRIGVLITNRPHYAVRRRAELASRSCSGPIIAVQANEQQFNSEP